MPLSGCPDDGKKSGADILKFSDICRLHPSRACFAAHGRVFINRERSCAVFVSATREPQARGAGHRRDAGLNELRSTRLVCVFGMVPQLQP
jgi:hypothetical protein